MINVGVLNNKLFYRAINLVRQFSGADYETGAWSCTLVFVGASSTGGLVGRLTALWYVLVAL